MKNKNLLTRLLQIHKANSYVPIYRDGSDELISFYKHINNTYGKVANRLFLLKVFRLYLTRAERINERLRKKHFVSLNKKGYEKNYNICFDSPGNA